MTESKNISQGAASSIADTDLVMCCTNGAYHPISFTDLMKAIRGGIQIGGRNYVKTQIIPNTNGVVTNGVLSFKSDADSYFYLELTLDPSQLAGETVTLSFDCSGMSAGSTWELTVNNRNDTITPMKNGRCAVTFVFKSQDMDANNRLLIDDRTRSLSGMTPSNLRLSRFKLERGNIATDWTPAPEDIASGSWGGVIVRYTNTYNLTEKGGAHDRNDKCECAAFCLISIPGSEGARENRGGARCYESSGSACDVADAECKDITDIKCRYHKGTMDFLFNDPYILGCSIRICRRCVDNYGAYGRYKSNVFLFLPSGNKEERHLRGELGRSVLPPSSRGRTSVVGKYIVNVRPRKEVAV